MCTCLVSICVLLAAASGLSRIYDVSLVRTNEVLSHLAKSGLNIPRMVTVDPLSSILREQLLCLSTISSVEARLKSVIKQFNNLHVHARQGTVTFFCLWLISPEAIRNFAFTSQKKFNFVEVYSLKANYSGLYILRIVKIFWEKKKSYLFLVICSFLWKRKKNQIWNLIGFLYHYNHSRNHGEKKKSYLLCIYLISYYVPYYVFIIK